MKIVLLPYCLVALLVFGVAWLVFDVVMPTPRLSNMREATVFLWSDIPEMVEHMICANDPAMFSPSLLDDKDVLWKSRTHYTPSWENGLPELRLLTDSAEQPLSSWPALFTSASPVVTAVAPVEELPVPTKIVFSETLAARSPSVPKFTPEGTRALQPMEFLIAVRDDGRVVHVFSLTASAVEGELEQIVIKALYASMFSDRTEQSETNFTLIPDCAKRGLRSCPLSPITWGTVTILWGNDQ